MSSCPKAGRAKTNKTTKAYRAFFIGIPFANVGYSCFNLRLQQIDQKIFFIMFLTKPDLYSRKEGRSCRLTFDGAALLTKVGNEQRARIPLKMTASKPKISRRCGFSYQLKSNYLIKLWGSQPNVSKECCITTPGTLIRARAVTSISC